MAAGAKEIPQDLKRRYSEFRLLGSGAMGRVYKATDNELLIDVAIKIQLADRGASPDAAIRFQREAQAASKLKHKNLVTVKDFGIANGDQLYLVMEFAKGETLASMVNGEPISLEQVVNVVSQICDGMSHAHTLGVVHRDLKPANIIVDGESLDDALIKVVDFGIAKVNDASSTSGGVTQHGELLGTPQFMSPEQILSASDIDNRSDIYSVGCIMFYLLTGRHPHDGETILELSQSKMSDIAPRINSVRQNSPVPETVEDVVECCLSASPDDRFATMMELKQSLLSAVQDPRQASDATSSAVTPKQNSLVVKGVAVLVAVAIVAIVGVFGIQSSNDKIASVQLKSTTGNPESSNVASSGTGVGKPSDVESQWIRDANLKLYFRQDSEFPTSWEPVQQLADKDLLLLPDSVRELKLQGQSSLTDDACLNISKLPHLSSLSITDIGIGDKGLSFLSKKCKNLSILDLGGTDITDRGLAAIAKLNLTELRVGRTSVTSAGMKYLENMKSLRKLNIADTLVDDQGLQSIADLPLEGLHIEGTKITDAGMKFLPGRRTLQRLHMDATSVGESGLQQIAAYPINELMMPDCRRIDNRCLVFICRTWPGLKKLVISHTNVSGDGLKEIGRLQNLEDLKVDGLSIGDAELSPVFQLKKLEEFTVRGLPITDATLARCRELPHLNEIRLANCKQVTSGGIQAMKEQCAKLKKIGMPDDPK